MYHHLKGVLFQKSLDQVIIEVTGVGYSVAISEMTYRELPQMGDSVFIYVHQIVRETEHLLFGFATTEERALFLNFLKVSGVGPSVALQILNQAPLQTIVQSVITGDLAFLTRLKGIGKKTAERIVVELRDKLNASPEAKKVSKMIENNAYPEDAFLALLTLGFSPEAARERLDKISKGEEMPEKPDDWIRLALKNG